MKYTKNLLQIFRATHRYFSNLNYYHNFLVIYAYDFNLTNYCFDYFSS